MLKSYRAVLVSLSLLFVLFYLVAVMQPQLIHIVREFGIIILYIQSRL